VAEGLNIEAIAVPTRQSEKLAKAVERLSGFEVPVVVVERSAIVSFLKSYPECNLFSIGFPYIIPKAALGGRPIALNIHPTLLPKYRGPTTGPYILMNNECESGSSVHYLTDEVDAGDIVVQSHVPIGPFDTVRSMQRKVYAAEPELVIEALRRLDSGGKATPQNERLASVFPIVRKPADSEIDPTKPLLELVNEIRACDPVEYPAFFMLHGKKVCIRLWRPDKSESEYDEI
jgi:methionyl-tRNA formyltransferase